MSTVTRFTTDLDEARLAVGHLRDLPRDAERPLLDASISASSTTRLVTEFWLPSARRSRRPGQNQREGRTTATAARRERWPRSASGPWDGHSACQLSGQTEAPAGSPVPTRASARLTGEPGHGDGPGSGRAQLLASGVSPRMAATAYRLLRAVTGAATSPNRPHLVGEHRRRAGSSPARWARTGG